MADCASRRRLPLSDTITRDLARHARPRIPIFRLGRTELRAIAAPNQDRENFLRIGFNDVHTQKIKFGMM